MNKQVLMSMIMDTKFMKMRMGNFVGIIIEFMRMSIVIIRGVVMTVMMVKIIIINEGLVWDEFIYFSVLCGYCF